MWRNLLKRVLTTSQVEIGLQSCFCTSVTTVPYLISPNSDGMPVKASSATELYRHVSPAGEFGISQKLMQRAVNKCPELLDISPLEMIYRLKNVQTHLNTSELKTMLSNSPHCLLLQPETLNKQIKKMYDASNIKTSEIRALLVYAGKFFDDYDVTKKKLDYLHLFMGVLDYEVDALILLANSDLEFMTERHEFLRRRGQHYAIDRHERTPIENPTIHAMFGTSQKRFCENVAKCDEAEFKLFKKVHKVESEILEKMLDDTETDDYDEDSELSKFAVKMAAVLKPPGLVPFSS